MPAGPKSRINPNRHTHRTALRTAGWVLLCTGAPLMVVGLVSFFTAFDGPSYAGGFPPYTWCGFVGLPLVGFGLMLLKLGYIETVTRYVAGEVAPVGTDVLEHVAEHGKGSARKLAESVGAGLRALAESEVRCPGCGEGNEPDANFCDGCGASLAARRPCTACGHSNDGAAKFCNRCGKGLTQQA